MSAKLFISCNSEVPEGEVLAKTHCSSCHLFPEPGLLPKNVWEHGTLPYMAIYLGIASEIANLKPPIADDVVLRPSQQLISDSNWEKIKTYYLSNSTRELATVNYQTLTEKKGLFEVEQIPITTHQKTLANFTYIAIDSINKLIFSSDQTNKQTHIFDYKGKLISTTENQNAISYIDFSEAKSRKYLFTYIGSTTQPNPENGGFAQRASWNGKTLQFEDKPLPKLNRATFVRELNSDKDKDKELVSGEYGYITGKVSLWNKNQLGNYEEKVLSNSVGAISCKIIDLNKDGKHDFVVLFAQGNERIVYFKNLGNNNFEEKVLIQFPPSYGSSSFELIDFNNDGELDILHTSGDNADFSTVLKPYHGLRVFINQENYLFKQSAFYFQNGAYKVIPMDFDLDGDTDIVTISMFPDVFNRPKEGFIFYENDGKTLIPKTLPIEHLGRWNVIDAGDLDGDGDIDIVLGSHPVAPFPSGFDQEWKNNTGLLILRNQTKK